MTFQSKAVEPSLPLEEERKHFERWFAHGYGSETHPTPR
jgi:hypothetical protein